MTKDREQRKKKGLCLDCSQPRAPHALCCPYHLRYRADRARRSHVPKKKAA